MWFTISKNTLTRWLFSNDRDSKTENTEHTTHEHSQTYSYHISHIFTFIISLIYTLIISAKHSVVSRVFSIHLSLSFRHDPSIWVSCILLIRSCSLPRFSACLGSSTSLWCSEMSSTFGKMRLESSEWSFCLHLTPFLIICFSCLLFLFCPPPPPPPLCLSAHLTLCCFHPSPPLLLQFPSALCLPNPLKC